MNLDNIRDLPERDSANMAGFIRSLPDQLHEASKLMETLVWPGINFEPHNIVLLGTGGGSAIAALLVQALFERELRRPLTLNCGMQLPGWVNRDSLVLATTVSGDTEETLTAFTEAIQREACCLAITSGGKLRALAAEHNISAYLFDTGGMPARAAIGYLFVPMAAALARLGLVRDLKIQLSETITLLDGLGERYGWENPEANNPAKQLARRLYGRLPIIYSADQLTYVAARRWKNQFSENSKSLAHDNTFPELNHDEIVGFENFASLREHIQVVYLCDELGDEPTIKQRMIATRQLIESTGGSVLEVKAEGQSDLARLFSLIYMGDWVSLYLALLSSIDPTPVRSIVEIKRLLRELPN
ncbi:MAG: bifunctional phosphoglucose/phosphomannose isomerase [Acidobacteriota bacterium]